MPRNGIFKSAAFPEPLEREFQSGYVSSVLSQGRVAIASGAVIFLLFHWWDLTLDASRADVALIMRFGISIALVLILCASWTKQFIRYYQSILAGGVLASGIVLVSIIYILHDGLRYGVGGIMLALFYAFNFTRLLFLPSVVCSLGTILAFNIASLSTDLPLQIFVINDFFLFTTIGVGFSATYLSEKQARTEFLLSKELGHVTDKLDLLIRDIFPERIASRLRAGEQIIAESHGEASVLFADLAGFTVLAKRVSPGHLLEILNEIFTKLDELTEHYEVEKIKTIGDAYMVVSGVSSHEQDGVEKLADFAIHVRSSIETYATKIGYPLAIRIGIATGQVISGVIGFKRLSFDLWGETVNLASRIESVSDVGSILVSEPTYWRLRTKYDFEERRMIQVKDLGEVPAYFLISKKSLGTAALAPEPPGA